MYDILYGLFDTKNRLCTVNFLSYSYRPKITFTTSKITIIACCFNFLFKTREALCIVCVHVFFWRENICENTEN